MLGEERSQQVRLVLARDGRQAVGLGYPLLRKQVQIGRVAMQDESGVQLLGQRQAPVAVLLDHGGLYPLALQHAGEMRADATAAEEHRAFHPLRCEAEELEGLVEMRGLGDQIDRVAGLNLGRAVRDQRTLPAIDGHRQEVPALEAATDLSQRAARGRRAGGNRQGEQHDLAVGELGHVGRRAALEKLEDLPRALLLGIDKEIGAEARLFEQIPLLVVLGVTDARDLEPHIELRGDQTGDEVDLVEVRDGQQKLGAADARPLEAGQAGAVSLYDEDVEHGLHPPGQVGVALDHGHVVLAGETGGQMVPDLSGSDHDDLQRGPAFATGPRERKASWNRRGTSRAALCGTSRWVTSRICEGDVSNARTPRSPTSRTSSAAASPARVTRTRTMLVCTCPRSTSMPSSSESPAAISFAST